MRRSTRIPKEVAVLLTGSDMEGKGFSEMTKTVLLSRHGAGIVSTYKLYAEQEIILRYLDTNREAVIRVVGRIGNEGDLFTYGVAFVDPNLVDFWGIDFPPATALEKEARRVTLECGTCGLRETVEHMEVESDVLVINEGIVRYCKACHDSTTWKRSAQVPEEEPVLVAATPHARASSFVGASSATADAHSRDTPEGAITAPSTPIMSTAPLVAATPVVPATPFDNEAFKPPVNVSPMAPPQRSSSAPPLPTSEAPPAASAPKPENRRKHARMKVTYKACIRRSGFPDDVVTCEDMSRGGICFKSRKRYYTDIEIEVAVPYAPGGSAIFVPAKIAWVVELPSEKVFRCGVTYRMGSRPS
jgi:hypothetical protein